MFTDTFPLVTDLPEAPFDQPWDLPEWQVVGKTEVCKNGNLAPRWNQRLGTQDA